MSPEEKVAVLARYWFEKAHEAVASGDSEARAGRLSFAMNRYYYAAFYAASAVLLARGHRFVKHSGVRSAVHQHLVRPGLLDEDLGKSYDVLFDRRQEGDYVAFVEFTAQQVDAARDRVESLLAGLGELLLEWLEQPGAP